MNEITDRELNTLVATKIMGWELLTVGHFDTDDETPRQKELEGWIEEHRIESVGSYWIKAGTHFWLNVDYWNPVIDISQAWLVLKKFPANIYRIAITTYDCNEDRPEKATWECAINKHAYIYHVWSSIADTASKAIVLAALKTLEKE